MRPGGSIPAGRFVAGVAIVATAGVVLTLVVLGIQVMLAAFGGVLLAVLLSAGAALGARHTPLSYGWSLTALVLLVVALLGVSAWLTVAYAADQLSDLGERLPTIRAEVMAYLQGREWGRWLLDEAEALDGEASGTIGAMLGMLTRGSSYVLVVVFVGLFGAIHPGLYRRGFVAFFPIEHRDRVDRLVGELAHTLRWWLVGQGIAMLLIGVSTALVLWAFGLPGALVLGAVVGLLGFVPYLGPILGAIPVGIVAALEGPPTLLAVMAVYVLVQTVEGYGITPLIQQRMVYLPPAVTVVTQILFGMVLGLQGFILATPLAAVGLVLTRFHRRELLGDEEATAPRGDDG